jgi:hypothetical protein
MDYMNYKYHYLVPVSVVKHPDPSENKRFLSVGGKIINWEMDLPTYKLVLFSQDVISNIEGEDNNLLSNGERDIVNEINSFFRFWSARSRFGNPTSIHLFHSNEEWDDDIFKVYIKNMTDEQYKSSMIKDMT